MERNQLEELLAGLIRADGTTLHLTPGQSPWMRIQGNIVPLGEGTQLTAQQLLDLTRDLLFEDQRDELMSGQDVEVIYTNQAGDRFRTTVSRELDGCCIVFRRVPSRIPTFQELDVPELLGSFAAFQRGLILFTGFFDAGKKATLAAMVNSINANRTAHVVTLEEQIDFTHVSDRALIHQREIGTHVPDIHTGVEQAAAMGADVLLASDLRSLDDLEAIFDAVDRGLLVLAGYEASCIVGALAELIAMAPSDARSRLRLRLANSLRVSVSQSSLQRRHGRGRVPLLEILIRNDAVGKAIRRGRLDLIQDIMARGRGLGMQTTDMALRSLLDRHVISAEEAAYHAKDREWVCGRAGLPSVR